MSNGDIARIVVKVGSAVLTDRRGMISEKRVTTLVDQLCEARGRGVEVALVSSGAIAAGMGRMEMKRRPDDITELQAAAAVGQGILMQTYSELFAGSGITVAQVLLTQADMNHRQRYLNARRTLEKLFQLGAVPIVNENDTVAIEEITFGDNDMLGALVAGLLKADLFVLLTDTGGLYTSDPRKSERPMLIPRVEVIDESIRKLAGEAGTDVSTGGMSTKIEAVTVATSAGIDSVIADGRKGHAVLGLLDGRKEGTFFPGSGGATSKKHWIGYAKKISGRLVLDEGAANAVAARGKSVLAAGVVGVEGEFGVDDCVDIVDERGTLIGRGLSSYDAADAGRVKGMRSQKAREVLGEKLEPLVHRDSMMVFKENLEGAGSAARQSKRRKDERG